MDMNRIMSVADAVAKLDPPKWVRAWLATNEVIYHEFCIEALKVVARGHKHYSSKTIVEVLRHHSAMREVGSAYKINNDTTPWLARLFATQWPQYASLFATRKTSRNES